MKLEKDIYSVSKNLDNLLNNNKCIQSIFISLSSVSENNYKYNLNNDDKEINHIMNCFFNAIQNNDSSNILDSFDIIFRSLPKYKEYIIDDNIKTKSEIYRIIFCQNNINFDLLNNNYYQNLYCELKMSIYYSISSCRNEMNKYSHDDFILWSQLFNVLTALHVLLDTIYCNKDAKDKYSIYYNNILALFSVAKKIKNKGYSKVSDDTKNLAKVLLCIYNNYHNYCK